MFEKPDKKLITYKSPGTEDEPYTRIQDKTLRYEVLDYMLAYNRWKNSVTNIENDTEFVDEAKLEGIELDHLNLKRCKKK